MTVLTPLSPAVVAARLKAGSAVLVDIREPDEFAREHVPGAVHAPLSRFEDAGADLPHGRQVIYTCRTGNRTGMNCVKLAANVPGEAFVLYRIGDAWAGRNIHAAMLDAMRLCHTL